MEVLKSSNIPWLKMVWNTSMLSSLFPSSSLKAFSRYFLEGFHGSPSLSHSSLDLVFFRVVLVGLFFELFRCFVFGVAGILFGLGLGKWETFVFFLGVFRNIRSLSANPGHTSKKSDDPSRPRPLRCHPHLQHLDAFNENLEESGE